MMTNKYELKEYLRDFKIPQRKIRYNARVDREGMRREDRTQSWNQVLCHGMFEKSSWIFFIWRFNSPFPCFILFFYSHLSGRSVNTHLFWLDFFPTSLWAMIRDCSFHKLVSRPPGRQTPVVATPRQEPRNIGKQLFDGLTKSIIMPQITAQRERQTLKIRIIWHLRLPSGSCKPIHFF